MAMSRHAFCFIHYSASFFKSALYNFISIFLLRLIGEKLNPSTYHMHHHRRSSSTLGLKFAVNSKLKEEAEEEDMGEEEEEEDEEEEEGFEEDEGETEEEDEFEEVEEIKEQGRKIREELIQLKKKRIDLDSGMMPAGNKKSTATAAAGGGGCSGSPPLICKVEKCRADLTDSKKYHKRHRVCECHAKAQVAIVDGLRQRFCQQCSRFHELPEFDDNKRSCRRRLEGHNARRRKISMESRGEGLDHEGPRLAAKKDQCRVVRERGRGQMVFPKNHRNLHIHS